MSVTINKYNFIAWHQIQDTAPQGYTVLYYNGTDHLCTSFNEQCYWADLQIAQGQCSIWSACKYLYQSDKHSPGTTGDPVYWARGYGDIITEKGAVLWKQQGICKYSHTYIRICTILRNSLLVCLILSTLFSI